jgi:3-hydroxyanthranilate 3,4-dioxygenase
VAGARPYAIDSVCCAPFVFGCVLQLWEEMRFSFFGNQLSTYFYEPILNLQNMAIAAPFNLTQWIENNRDLLKPPVGNKNLYPAGKDYIVMVVGGPNARKDYHFNDTEELFYQLEGTITVRIQEEGKPRDVKIGPGDMFLLPANVPHSPMRPEGSVGLVIERVRSAEHTDGLLWFCDTCNHKLHETYFPLTNIEKDFLPRFREFYSSEELRTCSKCGTVMDADPRFS